MTDFTPDLALALLRNNLTATQIADQAEREAYLAEIEKRLGGRSADDKKEATKLAVETAKMFLTIAIAVFLRLGHYCNSQERMEFHGRHGRFGRFARPSCCFSSACALVLWQLAKCLSERTVGQMLAMLLGRPNRLLAI